MFPQSVRQPIGFSLMKETLPQNIPMISKGPLPNAVVSSNNVPGILNIFEPILSLLNILGTCPLTKRNNNFGINFRNWRTTVCFLIGSLGIIRWLLFTWMLGLRRSVMGFKAPTHVKTLVDQVRALETDGSNKSTNFYDNFTLIGSHFVIPAVQILEILFCWAHSLAFGRFLNSFSKLEKMIIEFSNELDLPLDYLHRLRKHRNTACMSIFTFGASLVFIYAWNAEKIGTETVGIILVILSSGHLVFVPLIEDLKVTLSYKSLTEILYEVANDGTCVYEVQNLLTFTRRPWNSERRKQKMKIIRQIVLGVREQCEGACGWQQNRELMLILYSVLTITTLLYVVITSYGLKEQDDTKFRIKILCAGYGSIQIARVSLKGIFAENLGRQESQLATRIISLTTSEQNDDIAFEAKLTHDMLVQNPIKISLGGIVIVNKALNLKILSLVVTYLIVLSQYVK